MQHHVLALNGTSHVHFKGLSFAHSRSTILRGVHTTDINVSNCTFSNSGGAGVELLQGYRNLVVGSTIRHVGCSGLSQSGGEPVTLVRGQNAAVDNHIHDFGYWKRTYKGMQTK